MYILKRFIENIKMVNKLKFPYAAPGIIIYFDVKMGKT